MPDMRAASCGYPAAGFPAGGTVHLDPCLTDCPAAAPVFPGCQPASPGCQSGSPRLCSGNLLSGLKPDAQPGWVENSEHCACVRVVGTRLFHSMENLHLSGVSDARLYTFGTTCRSVDNELVFHYTTTATGHWCAGSSEALNRLRLPLRKDLPPLPQWFLPDKTTGNGGMRRGMREKLRSQSARVTEPNRPLKPQGIAVGAVTTQGPHSGEATHTCPAACRLACGPRLLSARHITSPEEIKQEVMRRLQLRRQRSSPNLARPQGDSPGALHSDCKLEPRRPPAGRLHIPTFEEFKRMRHKESELRISRPDRSRNESGDGSAEGGEAGDAEGLPTPRDSCAGGTESRDSGKKWTRDTTPGSEESVFGGAATTPVCMSPAPRSLLHPQAIGQEGPPRDPTRSGNGGMGSTQQWQENCEPPSSCCPSLLLDGTDLSSYGAKISRIRDGFIGSALDLIKKSCTAEATAEASVRWAREPEEGADVAAPQPSRQPAVVSIATLAGGAEMRDEPDRGGAPTTCLSSLGCRRSSLDVACERAESLRGQRSCRLRTHFSDPMPTDGARRKQLELKMAAAAASLQGRQRDRNAVALATKSSSETNVGAEDVILDAAKGGQHRWSNVSSLSADSGVVGLSDERDEDEVPRWNHPVPSEVQRMDSGIGPGLTRHWGPPGSSLKAWEAQQPCPDCGWHDPTLADGLCDRCTKLRKERKEAVLEFLNTEVSYGEDLRIIKEEFYCPMRGAGLLTTEQLAVVFGNIQELIDVNEKFTERLQDSIDRAFDQGDEDLLTVCIGEIFLQFVDMLPAFQTYCLQQCTSVNMLNNLEKEKELLRIFLDVSQNDNTALRRMNLRSFLMAPLQRVTKYPLLLNRISRATAERHPDGGRLREAKRRVESHLEHINMKTKQEGGTWSLRSFRRDSRRTREVGTMEMREVSMKAVGWTRESTRFVMEGPLQLSQPADGQWTKKGSKTLKFQNVQSLLMVRTQRAGPTVPEGGPAGQDPPEVVYDGVLVLIKDKSGGKFAVFREPIRLGNCVVSVDPDCDDTFELLDIPREAFVLRATDRSHTQQWFHQIRRYSCDLGPWRKRRNALPNIMISTAQNWS